MNYLPVWVRVLERFHLTGVGLDPDGQEFLSGADVEILWIHAKQLEKMRKVERILPMMQPLNEPIRDVMVFVPVHRLETRTLDAVMELEWDGPITRIFQTDNPTTNPYQNHLHQYLRGREIFLSGGYDAILIVESDIVPPRDALKKLAALRVDMAYGVYVFRQKQCNTVNVFERYPDNSGQRARNTGESLSCKPWLLWRAIRERTWPCSGGGFGCLLIRRRVLQQISFHLEKGGGYCDTPFTDEAYAAGFTMMADMSVLCDHIDKDGTVYKPKLPGLITQNPVMFPMGEDYRQWEALNAG